MALISLKSDYAFRELFSHENVRKQFLSDVLEIPLDGIKSVRVVSPYLWKRLRRQKLGILDMAMEMQDATKVNVEMQVRSQEYWIRLFNAKQEEDLDMVKVKNRGMEEAIEILKNLSLRKTLRYLHEERLKAICDRKAEDDYVRNEGRAEGKIEDILQLLEEVGDIPSDLRERIMTQRDVDVLRLWHKAAAKAESVEQFRKQCSL